jgi:3-oxoacyl-[acyl-carrier protein] reductase
MNKRLNVLITGGSKGIGKGIAEYYQSKNHNVLTPASSEINLENLDLIEEKLNQYKKDKKIDILICCAGVNENKSLDTFNIESGKRLLDINLLSNISLINLCSQDMKNNTFGRIVLIGSLWSEYVRKEKLFYSVSKHGLVSLTKTSALELAKYNILVNTVSPGFVNTDMTQNSLTADQVKSFKSEIPLERFAEPKEIASLVYYLGSDNNTYVTGQNIFIDGGWSVG